MGNGIVWFLTYVLLYTFTLNPNADFGIVTTGQCIPLLSNFALHPNLVNAVRLMKKLEVCTKQTVFLMSGCQRKNQSTAEVLFEAIKRMVGVEPLNVVE